MKGFGVTVAPATLLDTETSTIAGPALSVRSYTSVDEVIPLLEAWQCLSEKCPTATIFSTWDWLGPWWLAFGEGKLLLILGFFSESHELVGLAPLALAPRRVGPFTIRSVTLLGDGSTDSDNLDILALPGYERAVAECLLCHLYGRQRWDVIELNTVPVSSAVVNSLEALARAFGCHVRKQHIAGCSVALQSTWDDYARTLTAKERGKIGNRTRRLLARADVHFRKVQRETELPSALAALYDLHGTRWEQHGERGSFADERRRIFYDHLSRNLLRAGRLHFWFMDINGKPVAAQYGFRYQSAVYSLQEGFDQEHKADSAGYVLRAHVLKCLIEEGVERYDFLGGVNDSKLRWGSTVHHYEMLSLARPHTRGDLYIAASSRATAARGRLKNILPSWTLRALGCSGPSTDTDKGDKQ